MGAIENLSKMLNAFAAVRRNKEKFRRNKDKNAFAGSSTICLRLGRCVIILWWGYMSCICVKLFISR